MTRKQFLLTAPFAATMMRATGASRDAPELLLTDTKGNQIRLSLLRSKVVVLEFMLTTCSHCQNTAKLMSRLQKEYSPRGFQAISLPFNDDAVTAAPKFVTEYNVTHCCPRRFQSTSARCIATDGTDWASMGGRS